MKINIRHEIILALGLNDHLKSTIDKLYDERKWEYYEASKPFRDDIIIKTFSANKEETILKVAGIVNYSYTHEYNKNTTIELIKKGYKSVYNYVKSTKLPSLVDYAVIFNKKYNVMNVPEVTQFHHYCVLIYLTDYFKKNLELNHAIDEFIKGHLSILLEVAGFNLPDVREEISKNNYQKNKEKTDELKLSLFKDFKYADTSIDVLLSWFIENQTEQELLKKYNTSDMKKIPFEVYDAVRSKTFSEGISKYVGAYSGIVKTMGINPEYVATETLLSKSALDELLINVSRFSKWNKLSEDETKMFFISSLYIYNLTDLFKRLKESYLGDSQEDLFILNRNTQETIKKEQDNLASEKKKIEQERKAFKVKEAEYKKTANELEKELIKLNKQIALSDEHKKELVALREYAYKPIEENYEVEVATFEEQTELLLSVEAVVFGGHPKFIQKLKEKLPHFEYRETDSLNRSLEFVKNKEYVFLQTCFFNHPFYHKIMTEIEKNDDIKLVYLSGYANIELTIGEMYDKVKK